LSNDDYKKEDDDGVVFVNLSHVIINLLILKINFKNSILHSFINMFYK